MIALIPSFQDRQTKRFLARYPGPYTYVAGRDGVDDTFDVICLTTERHIASTFYWDDRLPCELIARVVTEALNAMLARDAGENEPFSPPLSDRELAAFRGMHPGPYHTAPDHCEYRGNIESVDCVTSDDSVISVYDREFRGQARLVTRQIAAALNQLPTDPHCRVQLVKRLDPGLHSV
jgi:hypothetical protein